MRWCPRQMARFKFGGVLIKRTRLRRRIGGWVRELIKTSLEFILQKGEVLDDFLVRPFPSRQRLYKLKQLGYNHGR